MSKKPVPEENKRKCIVGLRVTEKEHQILRKIAYFNNVTISQLFLKYLPQILETEIKQDNN